MAYRLAGAGGVLTIFALSNWLYNLVQHIEPLHGMAMILFLVTPFVYGLGFLSSFLIDLFLPPSSLRSVIVSAILHILIGYLINSLVFGQTYGWIGALGGGGFYLMYVVSRRLPKAWAYGLASAPLILLIILVLFHSGGGSK